LYLTNLIKKDCCKKVKDMQHSNSTDTGRISFVDNANRFLQKTQEHVLQGINPGGIYQAIWCRDAAYILRDWFLSGNIHGTMQQIYQIWSHQIKPDREKLVYGRGSPEMKFLSEVAKVDKQKEFQGSLPTTIYQAGFSEVYGQNPDIDSTALMISTSSWILARSLKDRQFKTETSAAQQTTIASEHSSDYVSSLLSKLGMTDPLSVVESVVPCMINAVEYLSRRDIDNDGLLEQNHNEDWMDTVLRAGKIVYSQACWILALSNLASLLSQLGRDDDSNKTARLTAKAIKSVDQNLWSDEDACYVDKQETHHIGGHYRTLTQDVSLYLVAITENTINEHLKVARRKHIGQVVEQQTGSTILDQNLHERSNLTLDAIRARVWKEKWPLVTEVELKATGPWNLKPYQYHNQTFWPWTTGIEMLARSRFDRIEECNILFSKLASEGHPHIHAFYEWVNPITDQPDGSFPFRTGISGIRTAIVDILKKIKSTSSSPSFDSSIV
jgi:familyl 116 glycosyl hydrolase-like protein